SAMLELEARPGSVRQEPHFDLRGDRVALEDVPGEDESSRRLPGDDGRPVSLLTSVRHLVYLAALPFLEDDLADASLVDRMAVSRPPALRIRGEDAKRLFDRAVHGDGLSHCLDDECLAHAVSPF